MHADSAWACSWGEGSYQSQSGDGWVLTPQHIPALSCNKAQEVLGVGDSHRDRKSHAGPPFLPELPTSWAADPQARANPRALVRAGRGRRWASAVGASLMDQKQDPATATALQGRYTLFILEDAFSVEISLFPLTPHLPGIFSPLYCF